MVVDISGLVERIEAGIGEPGEWQSEDDYYEEINEAHECLDALKIIALRYKFALQKIANGDLGHSKNNACRVEARKALGIKED